MSQVNSTEFLNPGRNWSLGSGGSLIDVDISHNLVVHGTIIGDISGTILNNLSTTITNQQQKITTLETELEIVKSALNQLLVIQRLQQI